MHVGVMTSPRMYVWMYVCNVGPVQDGNLNAVLFYK